MRLEDFILYLDENLDRCKPILEALNQQNVSFELHHTWFESGVDDDVWLPFVGERHWIIVTKDKRNRYNKWEKAALRRFKVREFYFGSGNMNGLEMAAALVAALPEMRNICQSTPPPFVASISRSGTVTILEDQRGSTHERRTRTAGPTPPDGL